MLIALIAPIIRTSSSGKMIGPYDLIVAATALEREGQIATFNKCHFANVRGLRVVEPKQVAVGRTFLSDVCSLSLNAPQTCATNGDSPHRVPYKTGLRE